MLQWNGIINRMMSVFSATTQKELSEALGVSQDLVSNWKKGKATPTWQSLSKVVEYKGISWNWLLTGNDVNLPSDSASNAIRFREPIPSTLNAEAIPVVGEAAADETEGSRAGFFPPDPKARYDEIHPPEATAAVRIIGNSMSPVLLDGQYAIIGPEYFGSVHPGDHDIVVANVEIRDEEQAGSDARWTGLYCKRIVDAGDVWVFLSINRTGTPFSVAKVNCRLWPVVGVWFVRKAGCQEGG